LAIQEKVVVAGFDGFVDTIVRAVDLRHGEQDKFTAIARISDFADRVQRAAGKGTNIELYPRHQRLGGCGPGMGMALLAAGATVNYIGALGSETVHPVFAQFASLSNAITVSDPGFTTAIEFDDGKVMLGIMTSLENVTFPTIVHKLGSIDALKDLVAQAHLVVFANWTMIPHMTDIFIGFLDMILPVIPPGDRVFFFDLADPEKRTTSELSLALRTISRFEMFGQVTLGLNLKEAQQVHHLLGFATSMTTDQGLCSIAAEIRERLAVSTIVIHATDCAASATAKGTYWVPGPFCTRPLTTTGGGDHFNAGFATGQLLGLRNEACLLLGVTNSGIYVRTGEAPTIDDMEKFLESWPA